MYHARHLLIPLTLRHTLTKHRAYNPLSFREFSSTPRAQASVESEDAFISKFKNTSIYKKLADRPEALKAIKDFVGVLEKQGFGASRLPTGMQMMRLAADSEFRAAIKRVMAEMQNAGVDLKSEEAMQEIMSIQKGDSSKP